MHEKCLSRSVHSACWTWAEDAEVGAAGAFDTPAAAAAMATAADALRSVANISSAFLNASGLGEELDGRGGSLKEKPDSANIDIECKV